MHIFVDTKLLVANSSVKKWCHFQLVIYTKIYCVGSGKLVTINTMVGAINMIKCI